jgi:DNA ligase (NAD+)
VDKLTEWLGDKEGVLSWKLDGLTLVLTYKEGNLVSAVTRGNGEVGEDVTHNILHIHGLPFKVPFKEKMVIRGEVLMTYSEFDRINAEYDVDAGYKNPRNLAAGTLRQLDSSVLNERRLEFFAFNFVSGIKGINSFSASLDFLESIGFQVVPHVLVTSSSLRERVADFKSGISSNDFPSDGLVLFYDDLEYGRSLGVTAKFPRNGIAFKWEDEAVESVLREVEWSASRTGLLNPVAIFDTVEIEGTNVSRASLHNISMIE